MPLSPLLSRWGGALLGAVLVFGGSVASSATPDDLVEPAPLAGVAASDGQPTSLALAVPITAPATTSGLITSADLAELTAPTGALTRQLNPVIDRPIALGIDPMILASIRILGSSAPDSAVAWLDRLENADNETFALAYGDADVAGLSQAGLTPISIPTEFVIDPSRFPVTETQQDGADAESTPSATPEPGASPAPSPSPSPSPSLPAEPVIPTGADLVDLPYSLGPVMWPRGGTVVAADLPVFAATGETVTILDSGNVSHTRDAIPASASSGGMPLLVSNTDMSLLLRSAVAAPSEAGWTTAMTELTAALTGWTGGSATVFVTLDRSLPTSTNRIAATLDALAEMPELVLTGIESALEEPPVEVIVTDQPVAPERVALLQSLLATEPATAAFATVLTDPTLITGQQRRGLLVLASNAWVENSRDWPGAVETYVARVGEILNSVHVLESSTINLLSDTGDLPITISNSLPYPVTVAVHVVANTGILDVLEDSVTVTIEPESQARAAVPVQSIANGTALLVVSLTSPSQVPVATPVYVTTNVQAGWETAFTTTVAVVVLIVFILGIARTVARRRRERRERESQSDAAAASPHEGGE